MIHFQVIYCIARSSYKQRCMLLVKKTRKMTLHITFCNTETHSFPFTLFILNFAFLNVNLLTIFEYTSFFPISLILHPKPINKANKVPELSWSSNPTLVEAERIDIHPTNFALILIYYRHRHYCHYTITGFKQVSQASALCHHHVLSSLL